MTIQLQPRQITAMWDLIKYGVLEANEIPASNTTAFLNGLLENLLSGRSQVWIVTEEAKSEEGQQVIGIVITYIQEDPLLLSKHLVLHSVCALKPVKFETFTKSFATFEKFAKVSECSKIVIMTVHKRIADLAVKIGLTNERYVFSKDV